MKIVAIAIAVMVAAQPLTPASRTLSPLRGARALEGLLPARRGEGGRRPDEGRTIETYIATLQRIRALVKAGNLNAARTEAQSIAGAEVTSPAGTFHADDALLKTIDAGSAARIDATIAELQRIQQPAKPAAPNPKLLDALAREEAVTSLREDGKVDTDVVDSSTLAAFSRHFRRAMEWITNKLSDFYDWLSSFWPKKSGDEKKPASMRGIVIAIAVVIVLLVLILAIEALRRSRRAPKELVQSMAPAASARDEDPLSRAANEWEIYAEKLAAAGRCREAIRAWYHAILVTLYGAAILHFRKGKTNWEYVASLSPALAWRRDFVEMTRRFESEWYGHDESSGGALDDCASLAKTILDSVRRGMRGAA